MGKKIVLLGLTTTPKANWRYKIKEIKKFNIREIALFPTFLGLKDRKELYQLLEQTDLKKIPHVHLRDDMKEWELDYFVERWGSKLFNVHANKKAKYLLNTKHAYRIYIENQSWIDDIFMSMLQKSGGLCIDFAHWADQGIKLGNYDREFFSQIIKKNKVGCCHVSAMNKRGEKTVDYFTKKTHMHSSAHYLRKLEQLDYMRDLVEFLPNKYISIELENSFAGQLEAKVYLEKILKI